MSELRWVAALLRRRTGRMLAVAAGIAVAVALLASIGSFVAGAKRTMTARSINQVAVDWQVETQPGADPSSVRDQVSHSAGVAAAASVEFAATAGLESNDGVGRRRRIAGGLRAHVSGVDPSHRRRR